MKKLLLFLIFIVLSASALLAQARVITGTVTSSIEGEGTLPAITVILTSLSEIKYNSNLTEKVQNIIEIRKKFYREYIEKAQKNGEIPSGMNSDILVDVFLGTMNELCFEWRMSGFSFSLKEKCLSAVRLLIYGFKVNRKDGYNYDQSNGS